jgi:hypothetical protein
MQMKSNGALNRYPDPQQNDAEDVLSKIKILITFFWAMEVTKF